MKFYIILLVFVSHSALFAFDSTEVHKKLIQIENDNIEVNAKLDSVVLANGKLKQENEILKMLENSWISLYSSQGIFFSTLIMLFAAITGYISFRKINQTVKDSEENLEENLKNQKNKFNKIITELHQFRYNTLILYRNDFVNKFEFDVNVYKKSLVSD